MTEQPAPRADVLPPHAAFAEAVGDDFTASDENGDSFALMLASCSDRLSSGGYSSFSLSFVTESPARQQAIYTLRHPSLGEMAIFLVPSRADAGTSEYIASFNSLES